METLNVSTVPVGPPDLNLSDGDVSKDRPEAEFSVTFLVLLLLSGLTVMTNSLILATFYVERKLRTYTNCFILNMTIADFVVGFFCMPILSMINLFNGWPFGKVASIFFTGFQNSILGVSVCGVVVVCIDRYLATFYPIQHYQRRSIRKATVANALTWIACFGVWMMVSSAWDFIKPTNLVISSGISRPNYSLTYTASLLVFALRFGLPFLLMTGLYLRIYFRVKNIGSKHLLKYIRKGKGKGKEQAIANSPCRSKKTGPFSTQAQDILEWQTSPIEETVTVSSISLEMINTSATTNKVGRVKIDTEENEFSPNMPNEKKNPNHDHLRMEDLSREDEDASGSYVVVMQKPAKRESRVEGQKAMRTLTFIVLVFILTWLPTAIAVMMYAFAPMARGTDFYLVIQKTIWITRWIAFSNSLVNPLAYAIAQPLFRQTIVKILCARRKPC